MGFSLLCVCLSFAAFCVCNEVCGTVCVPPDIGFIILVSGGDVVGLEIEFVDLSVFDWCICSLDCW